MDLFPITKRVTPILTFSLLLILSGCESTKRTSTSAPKPEEVQVTLHTAAAEDPLAEHLYKGNPSDKAPRAFKGYVTEYDPIHRVPRWVAYHIKKDYLKTPSRSGRFSSFRSDPEIENPVKDTDYEGIYEDGDGFARGHLAPYGAMGGDRNNDGKYASIDIEKSDKEDEETIFQANYLSNIAPQYHNKFNGGGGLWYKLERWEQRKLADKENRDVWVVAGCIFDKGREPQKVGEAKDIGVPQHFFKIVIYEVSEEPAPRVFAFYFEHPPADGTKLEACLNSVAFIEEKTGLNFMRDLPDEIEKPLETQNTRETWNKYYGKW